MDMGFPQAGGRDADKFGSFAKLLNGGGTDIAHAGTKSAQELVDNIGKRPAVRDFPFNAFGDKLGLTAYLGLEIAV